MSDKVTNVSSLEIGYLLTSHCGMIRLISIVSSFVLWFLVSLLCLVLYLHNLLPYNVLLSYAQAVSLIGLSPIAAAALTWRFFEMAISKYLELYTKKHLQK